MKTQPLTAAEQARIDDAMSAFVQMARDAGFEGDEEDIETPELAEELLGRWAAESPKGRLPTEIIATIVGAALGDYLRLHLRLTWAVAVHNGERAVGLASEVDGEAVLSPFDAVRQCIEAAAEGDEPDVGPLFDDLPAEYPHLLRKEQ
ncbi:MAG: hypothetical protein QM783_11275 [Phycisphaerales bacterium]